MPPRRTKAGSKAAGKSASPEASSIGDSTFRALIENSNDAIVLFDSEWNIIYASAGTEKILGYTSSDVLNAGALDFVHPDDITRARRALEESLAHPGKPIQSIGRVRHKDGSWRTLNGVFTNWLDDPHVRGIVNNCRDITESVQAGEALRESEEKFQRAFRSNPDAMSITTLAEGKYLDVNDALVRLTGFSRDELVGRLSLETSWVNAKDRARMVRGLREHGRVDSLEVSFWKKDGESFVANLSAEVIEVGGVKCVLATSQDITERRRAAEELRHSEEQYRSMVELAPYGIYRATREGRILMVNSALVRMLGYDSHEEVLRLDLAKEIYDDPEERDHILRGIESGPMPRSESTWKRKDGSRISVRLAARLIYDDQRRLLQTEVFVENVTEQRTLEKQLQTAQKMEAIGQLAGGVAHDFNNLLMIIRSRAALVINDAARPEQVVEQAEEIVRATKRAGTLTRQLLAFSRNQALEPVVLDLNVLLAELGSLLPHLVGKQIEIRIHTGSRLGRVRIDPGQFEQVVVNLAVNARDAMPRGGRLAIETSNVELDGRTAPGLLMKPGRYVMLAVTDSGAGMDKETQSHIFEPFFTTKGHGKGTGLGLAMVYGVVEQSGGHISVVSAPGAGTSFRIYLPEVADSAVRVQAEGLVPAPGGIETILFVEDEEALRQVGADFLRSKGYDVLVAENGVEALALCRTSDRPIQLLVTDLIMPRMGGVELARNALSLNPDLRTLYVSGYRGALPPGALESGQPFLQKPFSMADLAAQVRVVLDNKAGMRQDAMQPRVH